MRRASRGSGEDAIKPGAVGFLRPKVQKSAMPTWSQRTLAKYNKPAKYTAAERAKYAAEKARKAALAAARAAGPMRTSGYTGRFTGPSAELKYLDAYYPESICTGATAFLMTIVAQGTGPTQRIGAKLTVRSLQLTMTLHMDESGVDTHNTELFRVLVVEDRQCNGATHAITDLLDTAHGQPSWKAYPRIENGDRFKIIYDQNHQLERKNAASSAVAYTELPGTAAVPNGGGFTNPGISKTWGEAEKTFKIYKPLDINVLYTGTAGVTADHRSNSLWLWVIPEHGSGNDTRIGFNSRIRYSDN